MSMFAVILTIAIAMWQQPAHHCFVSSEVSDICQPLAEVACRMWKPQARGTRPRAVSHGTAIVKDTDMWDRPGDLVVQLASTCTAVLQHRLPTS
jgi:hypothetical protein